MELILAIVALISFIIMYVSLLNQSMKTFFASASIFLFGGGYFCFISSAI